MAHLAIVLPGGNYGPNGPALRLPALAAQSRGAEILDSISYPPAPPGGLPSLDLDANRGLFGATRDQVQAVVDADECTEVTFIAKSLGTMVLGAVGRQLPLPRRINAIWITPLFDLDYVRQGAVSSRWRSLVVSGTADRFYSEAATDSVVRELGAAEVRVEGANNSLEVPCDVLATLGGIERMVTATLELLAP